MFPAQKLGDERHGHLSNLNNPSSYNFRFRDKEKQNKDVAFIFLYILIQIKDLHTDTENTGFVSDIIQQFRITRKNQRM